ncbi:ATP-binding protein [Vibrio hepatarius]|uniref:ATP-binding protein n=1 Tax=Vibrio hepatarius TaxID=171383 RepID=UPI0037360BED
MSKGIEGTDGVAGRFFIGVISALCLVLMAMIVYFFYSLSEIRNIPSQPYVTIVNNNLAAKNKLLLLKSAANQFALAPSSQALVRLKVKARVFRSSIMQDLRSKETQRVHKQYGNINSLAEIIAGIEQASTMLQKVTLVDEQVLTSATQNLDAVYKDLNEYLSGFITEVQKHQLEFNRHKENLYAKQYVNLAIILVCSLLMIGVISWMYLNQSKLSRDLKERSIRLEEAKQQAEESAKAKARFLANMSHEMRTPLNAVIGLSQKEYYQESDKQTKEFISMINNSGQHLLKLINSVLDLSKIEQGQVALEKEEFNVSELINSCKSIFVETSKPEVDVFFRSDLDKDFKLFADRTKLLQVINNLSYNAVKFTSHGHVDIHSAVTHVGDQRYLVMTITDTGIGMSQEQIARVFNEFTQADESITRLYGGTGLGLSICQSLVDLMNGTISVESELEKGTCFTVTVPVDVVDQVDFVSDRTRQTKVQVVTSNHYAEQLITSDLKRLNPQDDSEMVTIYYQSERDEFVAPTLPKEEGHPVIYIGDVHSVNPEIKDCIKLTKPYDIFSLLRAIDRLSNDYSEPVLASNNADLQGISILIVEDMKVNQIVAEKMLSVLNVNTTLAYNGQECLDALESQHFDIILMDIQMPIMDGIEALKQIKQRHLAPNTAIIALTANTFESDVSYYLEQGFDDVIPKPFQLDWMKGMLEKHSVKSLAS